jgi:hypothetical protein
MDEQEYPIPSRQELLDRIVCRYTGASGTDICDCSIIAQRFDGPLGFRAGCSESWVCHTEPTDDGFGFVTDCLVETEQLGLWRSLEGQCFVAGNQLLYHPDIRDDADGSRWQYLDLPDTVAARGVWGLSEDLVYVWGGENHAFLTEWESPMRMFQCNRGALSEMPTPNFLIKSLHGTAPDCLYAVGADGNIAQWDGVAWRAAPSPVKGCLRSVFVVSPEEIWAVGDDGLVCRGRGLNFEIDGVQVPAAPMSSDPALHAVAHFCGDLWLAAGTRGLWRKQDGAIRYECAQPKVRALGLDARKNSLLACEFNRVSGTHDGESFLSAAEDSLKEFRAPFLELER